MWEKGPDLEAFSPAFAFLNEDFIPLRLGKPNVESEARVCEAKARVIESNACVFG